MNEKLERFWDWFVYEGDFFCFIFILCIIFIRMMFLVVEICGL